MSFLLDPIESGISSLLEPLTSSPTTTSSSDDTDPVETSTTVSSSKTTKASKSTSTPSLAASAPTATTGSSTSSARSTPSSPSSSSSDPSTTDPSQSTSTATDTTDSSITSLPTTTPTTLSTSTITSSSSSSSSTNSISTPAAPSASPEPQPSLSPAQSTNSTPTPDSSTSSGPSISTAGIVIASLFAAGILVSIIWLTIRFCPPVRKRIDGWYERRREERTYRAALDGSKAEKGSEKGSLSSAGTAMSDPTRPFSFFETGREKGVAGGDGSDGRGMVQQRQSYVAPSSAGVYTPISARSNGNGNANGHGLGLGRVSLLRNTSLLRKAGFDAPPQPPLPLFATTSTPTSSTPTTHQHQRQYQNQHPQPHPSISIPAPIRSMKPSLSQIKRKPLPADPPSTNRDSVPGIQSRTNGPSLPRGMTNSTGYRSRGGSRDNFLPRLQIQIPGRPPGLAEIERVSQIGLAEIERVSQIGLAVTGSPAVRGGR